MVLHASSCDTFNADNGFVRSKTPPPSIHPSIQRAHFIVTVLLWSDGGLIPSLFHVASFTPNQGFRPRNYVTSFLCGTNVLLAYWLIIKSVIFVALFAILHDEEML